MLICNSAGMVLTKERASVCFHMNGILDFWNLLIPEDFGNLKKLGRFCKIKNKKKGLFVGMLV